MLTPLPVLVKMHKMENALRDLGKKYETLSQLLDLEIHNIKVKQACQD